MKKNTLSRFITAFLPRSKRLLISWLHSPSTVILEPKKIKSVTIATLFLSICCEVMVLQKLELEKPSTTLRELKNSGLLLRWAQRS